MTKQLCQQCGRQAEVLGESYAWECSHVSCPHRHGCVSWPASNPKGPPALHEERNWGQRILRFPIDPDD